MVSIGGGGRGAKARISTVLSLTRILTVLYALTALHVPHSRDSGMNNGISHRRRRTPVTPLFESIYTRSSPSTLRQQAAAHVAYALIDASFIFSSLSTRVTPMSLSIYTRHASLLVHLHPSRPFLCPSIWVTFISESNHEPENRRRRTWPTH